MQNISSTKNSKIQYIKSLYTSKGRTEHAAFVVEGEHMVQEALQYANVQCIAVDESYVEKYKNLLQGEVLLCTSNVFKSISDTKTPQGICAVCNMQESPALSNKILICNAVQDPGNVGTLIRTADAAGFSVLLDNQCADIYNPKVLRSTMGSIFHIAVKRSANIEQNVRTLINDGFAVYAAILGGEAFYERKKDASKLAIMIGNEGKGIAPALQELCTHTFTLPMLGKAESLNAGVAGAIMMYDIIRKDKENEQRI